MYACKLKFFKQHTSKKINVKLWDFGDPGYERMQGSPRVDFTDNFAQLFFAHKTRSFFGEWRLANIFGKQRINLVNFTLHIGQISPYILGKFHHRSLRQNVGEIEEQIIRQTMCVRNFLPRKQKLEKSTPGVNYINILWVALACPDPKSAKKTLKLTVFFALLGSAHSKADRRMLMNLTACLVDYLNGFNDIKKITYNWET